MQKHAVNILGIFSYYANYMRILSIDIGIKHLAFCLFNINTKENYKIEKWGVIDLCNEKKSICEESKNEKKCKRTPKYTKNGKAFCKIHARTLKYHIPPKEYKLDALKKLKLHQLKELYTKLELVSDTKKSKKIYLQEILAHIQQYYFDFIISPKAKDFNITALGRNMKTKFNEILNDIESLEHVIVENQIGPLANRMKTIQGMVMQHFIEQDVPNILEIAASNKLKTFLDIGEKTTYNQRKRLSIEITDKQLKDSKLFHTWREFFISHKKKDDLADSFLQGLWYLRTYNFI